MNSLDQYKGFLKYSEIKKYMSDNVSSDMEHLLSIKEITKIAPLYFLCKYIFC